MPKPIKFESELLEIRDLTKDVKHFVFSSPKDFTFEAGQFVNIAIDKVRRPYSIASSPELNKIELCVKLIETGQFTPELFKLKEEDKIQVIGPMGFFKIKDDKKDLVFISTGTGVTPFRSMLLNNNFKNKITLIAGYKHKEDELYKDEFKKLEKTNKNFEYLVAYSREDDNKHVQDILVNYINKKTDYYICGLKEMVFSVRAMLSENVLKENIFFERYD